MGGIVKLVRVERDESIKDLVFFYVMSVKYIFREIRESVVKENFLGF